MIEDALKTAEAGCDLTLEQTRDVMDLIMQGHCSEQDVARLLSALHRKGETVTEVAGAAAAMRRHMTPVRSRHRALIDTCGTGGDGLRTFNISTAAAVVTAAAGVPVAKHGNRSMTSRSGSADVLVALGVNIEADVSRVEQCLDELGICFCFAPLLHRAMKHVAAARKQLPHPTIFNLLGPLANPAGAPFQLLGVGRPDLRSLLAEALGLLGTQRAAVVHGADGLDEVTLAGVTHVTEVTGAGQREFQWSPPDFGLSGAPTDSLRVDSPQQSAEVIGRVLAGRRGPPRDIVVANAAAALWTAGRSPSPEECASLAAEAIDRGSARRLLDRLVQRTAGG